MIPNILNTIVGIALVYCAILAPQLLQKTAWVLVVSGLGIIVGIYAIYLLVVLGFLKGTSGPNNYGPDPLQR